MNKKVLLLLPIVLILSITLVSPIFASAFIPMDVDIKPGSWPNPINPKSKGVLTVAILGTEDFDVMTIDPETVRLFFEGAEGEAEPLRWSYEDVSRSDDTNGDGFVDLVLKFKTQDLVMFTITEYMGETIDLIISGNLKREFDGASFLGQDEVLILGKNS
jgi:hypothetical protein